MEDIDIIDSEIITSCIILRILNLDNYFISVTRIYISKFIRGYTNPVGISINRVERYFYSSCLSNYIICKVGYLNTDIRFYTPFSGIEVHDIDFEADRSIRYYIHYFLVEGFSLTKVGSHIYIHKASFTCWIIGCMIHWSGLYPATYAQSPTWRTPSVGHGIELGIIDNHILIPTSTWIYIAQAWGYTHSGSVQSCYIGSVSCTKILSD